jgi:hypothetical protein
MAAPAFVPRSYAGGAPVATISAPVGATDTSFTISPTTGWTSADGHALGTDGPFVIDIDRGLASEEKILCVSINLGTGLVQVYNTGGFLGRGYDQTTATTHTPSGGSPLNGACQVVWTAVEALEANKTASFLLGSAGGTPATGNLLTWGSGQPLWAVPAFIGARLGGNGSLTIGSGGPVQIINMVNDASVTNGVTVNAPAGTMTILTAGRYSLGWQIQVSPGNSPAVTQQIWSWVTVNSSVFRQGLNGMPVGTFPTSIGIDPTVHLNVSDTLALFTENNLGANSTLGGNTSTWLSIGWLGP